jgi:hypothetical protein
MEFTDGNDCSMSHPVLLKPLSDHSVGDSFIACWI